MLDYLTLYIVILLNSLTVCVIWAAVSYTYRSFTSARIWLLAGVMTTIGGAVLAAGGAAMPVLMVLTANGFVIFGFYLYWVGVRDFHGTGGGWRAALVLTTISVALIAVFLDQERVRGSIIAAAQSLPMILASVFVMRVARRSLGGTISAVAMLTSVAGHCVMIAINIRLLSGYPETPLLNVLPSYTLLTVIFGGMVSNFGFAIMTIDRLRSEVAALATTDELTGVANLRALRERLKDENARALRSGRPYTLMIVDMDKLKTINDRHGHAAGDAAIVRVARAAEACVRETDLVARIGGDEFCVLLPETETADALGIAKAIARAVRDGSERDGSGVMSTVSIGIAQSETDGSVAPDEIFRRADRALYGVKFSGGDSITLHADVPPQTPELHAAPRARAV